MRDLGLRGVGLAGVACALALVLLPADAGAGCLAPTCCDAGGGLDGSIAQAEVVSVEAGHVTLSLLPTPVYCAGGVECPAADFPTEFSWGSPPCEWACGDCDSLAVGDRRLFVVDGATGCLERTIPLLEGGGVLCDDFSPPVDFVLEHFMDPDCYQAHLGAHYFDECDDTLESCAACAHAGQGGGVVLALVVGLGLMRRKRPRA